MPHYFTCEQGRINAYPSSPSSLPSETTRMRFPKTSAKGSTMGAIVGFLVLFVLGASWSCDARELMTAGLSSTETATFDVSVLQINHQESEGVVKVSEVEQNENPCTLCEEFAAEAIKYLEENNTRTQIIDTLLKTCSRLTPFEQQCTTLVDHYVPLLFSEIESVQPVFFCQKVKLCKQPMITSRPPYEDKCEICHVAVAELLLKLKNPDTQLDIIEVLLKTCDVMESYVKLKKCKTLVVQYGPLILANAEQYLETTDICTAIHACELPSSPIEKTSLFSTM